MQSREALQQGYNEAWKGKLNDEGKIDPEVASAITLLDIRHLLLDIRELLGGEQQAASPNAKKAVDTAWKHAKFTPST